MVILKWHFNNVSHSKILNSSSFRLSSKKYSGFRHFQKSRLVTLPLVKKSGEWCNVNIYWHDCDKRQHDEKNLEAATVNNKLLIYINSDTLFSERLTVGPRIAHIFPRCCLDFSLAIYPSFT